jgi:hypothetical protein
VNLPDGRVQIVTYTASAEKGYVADVRYEGKAVYPDNPPPVHTAVRKAAKAKRKVANPNVANPFYRSHPEQKANNNRHEKQAAVKVLPQVLNNNKPVTFPNDYSRNLYYKQ